MMRHLLKLIWRRRRANALVMVEIFVSFLIVFVVATMAMAGLSRWSAPLGFTWQNVWVVNIQSAIAESPGMSSHSSTDDSQRDAEARRNMSRIEPLLRELRTMPQVEAAAADAMTPYSDSTWQTALRVQGRRVVVTADQVTDDFARVMHPQLLRGRWFEADDDGAGYAPIIVDTNAAHALFGSADPIGQRLPPPAARSGDDDRRELRVVGVVAPFRKDGELTPPDLRMVFFRASFLKPQLPGATTIVIAARPGTSAAFESELSGRLHAVAPDLTFRLQRMAQMRNLALQLRIAPVAVLATIALFLIVMVGLGLTGVLWQNVTRRMREMGVRRALGASGANVRHQVLAEVALLATLSIAAGSVIVLQLPLLGVMRFVTAREFAAGFGGALAVIYAITLLCGAYPSWLASTIAPAEALRYE